MVCEATVDGLTFFSPFYRLSQHLKLAQGQSVKEIDYQNSAACSVLIGADQAIAGTSCAGKW